VLRVIAVELELYLRVAQLLLQLIDFRDREERILVMPQQGF
jgi:hypothetical protein